MVQILGVKSTSHSNVIVAASFDLPKNTEDWHGIEFPKGNFKSDHFPLRYIIVTAVQMLAASNKYK